MKIHVLSDLHIEFGAFTLPETDADVIVLAGDIGEGKRGLDWLYNQTAAHGKPVIYVPGNHEYYNHDLSLFNDFKDDNIHLLNNKAVVIEGVRFLGCTLWTDFELNGLSEKFFAVHNASSNMADFSLITDGYGTFTPDKSIELHNKSLEWLGIILDEEFEGKTVVVTHHVPSEKSCHPRFVGSILNPAFASNLEWMMDGDRISLLIHGHTHDAYDYEINGTRVVCNPRGYARYELETGFNPEKVIEI